MANALSQQAPFNHSILMERKNINFGTGQKKFSRSNNSWLSIFWLTGKTQRLISLTKSKFNNSIRIYTAKFSLPPKENCLRTISSLLSIGNISSPLQTLDQIISVAAVIAAL